MAQHNDTTPLSSFFTSNYAPSHPERVVIIDTNSRVLPACQTSIALFLGVRSLSSMLRGRSLQLDGPYEDQIIIFISRFSIVFLFIIVTTSCLMRNSYPPRLHRARRFLNMRYFFDIPSRPVKQTHCFTVSYQIEQIRRMGVNAPYFCKHSSDHGRRDM